MGVRRLHTGKENKLKKSPIQLSGYAYLVSCSVGERGEGGLNLPLPVPFNPGSRSVLFGSPPLHFFDCEILRNVG